MSLISLKQDLMPDEYDCCHPEEIFAMQQKATQALAAKFLACDAPTSLLLARVALVHCANQEDMFAAAERFFHDECEADVLTLARKLGLLNADAAAHEKISEKVPLSLVRSQLDIDTVVSRLKCGSCLEDHFVERMTSLGCAHFFCNKCWREYISVRVGEGMCCCEGVGPV